MLKKSKYNMDSVKLLKASDDRKKPDYNIKKAQLIDVLGKLSLEKRFILLLFCWQRFSLKQIAKAYEEMVAGDIPREVLLGLVDKYQSERNEKNSLACGLANHLAKSDETEQDIHQWIELIKRYISVEEIDRGLLLRLIDKIIMGQKTEVNGVLQQNIIIVYNECYKFLIHLYGL